MIDNDKPGRRLESGLIQQYRQLKTYRDIFILNRIFPRTASERNALTKQIEKYNGDWKGLDCEIEDLLSSDFIELFVLDNPNALKYEPIEMNGHYHYEWTNSAKDWLWKFAKDNAALDDVLHLVEILRSLRFYLGLPPEGI